MVLWKITDLFDGKNSLVNCHGFNSELLVYQRVIRMEVTSLATPVKMSWRCAVKRPPREERKEEAKYQTKANQTLW